MIGLSLEILALHDYMVSNEYSLSIPLSRDDNNHVSSLKMDYSKIQYPMVPTELDPYQFMRFLWLLARSWSEAFMNHVQWLGWTSLSLLMLEYYPFGFGNAGWNDFICNRIQLLVLGEVARVRNAFVIKCQVCLMMNAWKIQLADLNIRPLSVLLQSPYAARFYYVWVVIMLQSIYLWLWEQRMTYII